MKTTPTLVSLALLLGASGSAAAQSTQEHKLSWLQGCWAAVSQERAVEEQWMAPRGKTMLGSSRTVEGAKLVGYEYMMIREQGSKYAIEVRPSGKPPVVFTQASLTDSSVVFENPKHGYPQKIGYSRNGVSRRFEFPYRQVVCAGSA